MKKILLASVLLATPAFAQQSQPAEYVIRLTPQEMNIVGEALGDLPFKKAAPVINAIQKQMTDGKKTEEKKAE